MEGSEDSVYKQSPGTSGGDLLTEGLKAIRRSIDKYEYNINETEAKNKVSNFIAKQWKETAHVMDRFLFVVYLLLITISLGLFFPKPHTD